MVTPDGQSLQQVPEGVSFRDAITHTDERGSVCEIFDPRWGWHEDPLRCSSTCSPIRPGMVKGWNLHKEHEDRYFIVSGDLELVLYDDRPESSTRGLVSKIVLSEHRRRLVNVPKNVWHADHNIGTKDVLVVNCPTTQYDHENPDKYRLPIDSDLIPYSFEGARGG